LSGAETHPCHFTVPRAPSQEGILKMKRKTMSNNNAINQGLEKKSDKKSNNTL
jgi:hypothetical protein